MKKITKTCGEIIAKGAKSIAKMEANVACPWIHYQPRLPESVKKLGEFYSEGIPTRK